MFKKLCSLNDDAYMSTMGVGSNNSHWSQTNDMHFDDHEFEVDEDGEGIVDAPKGREAITPTLKTSYMQYLVASVEGSIHWR